GSPELERREPIPVNLGSYVRRVRIRAGAHDPADLSVRLHALTDEVRGPAKDEVPFHRFPGPMKLVMIEPHIGAGTGQSVFLFSRIIVDRTGILDPAYVPVTGKCA